MIVVGVIAIILFAAAVWAVMYPSCCARRLGLCSAGSPVDMAAGIDDPLPLMEASALAPSASAGPALSGATAGTDNAGLRAGTVLLDKSGVEIQAAGGAAGLAPVGAAMAPFDDAPAAWTSGASELSASASTVAGSAFPGGAQAQGSRLAAYQGSLTRRLGGQTHRDGRPLSRQIGNNADIRSQWSGHVGDQAGIQINSGPVRSANGTSSLELPSNGPQFAQGIEGATISAETQQTQSTNPLMTMRQRI